MIIEGLVIGLCALGAVAVTAIYYYVTSNTYENGFKAGVSSTATEQKAELARHEKEFAELSKSALNETQKLVNNAHAGLDEVITTSKEYLSELEESKSSLKIHVNAIQIGAEEISKAADGIEQVSDDNQSKIEPLILELDKKKDELGEANIKIAELTQSLCEEKNKLQGTLNELEAVKSLLQRNHMNAQLIAPITTLTLENAEMEAEIQEIRSMYEDAYSKLEHFNELSLTIQQLYSENALLGEQVVHLSANNLTQRHNVNSFQNSNTHSNQSISALIDTLNLSNHAYIEITNTAQRYLAENVELRRQMQNISESSTSNQSYHF